MYDIPSTPLELVIYAFRALGKEHVSLQNLSFFISFDLHQMPPSQSKNIILDLISKGDLIIQDDFVSLSPTAEITMTNLKPIQKADFGELLRKFVSSSRLSRAVGLDDKALKIRRVTTCPVRIEAIVHGTKDYTIVLDEEQRMITHNCPDWRRVSVIRRFCKHVAKLFMMLDKKEAIDLLNSIQDEAWRFEES